MSAGDSSANVHSTPADDTDCVFCCEPLTLNNYAEFRNTETSIWRPSPYCSDCISTHFINLQWSTYVGHVEAADCAAALRRALAHPPPEFVSDVGFKSDESATGQVREFWFSGNGNEQDGQPHSNGAAGSGRVVSARLVGALSGKARDDWWNEKKAFLVATEAEELARGGDVTKNTPAPMPDTATNNHDNNVTQS